MRNLDLNTPDSNLKSGKKINWKLLFKNNKIT